ncbi:hypothetical protein [Amycolatopsis sp. NPDC004625]|uniref:hypothetical protein n=1 Tax=Amycolatopsis sp. NPDC004625 TaxID=3154670 RepID=UPI0033BBC4A9
MTGEWFCLHLGDENGPAELMAWHREFDLIRVLPGTGRWFFDRLDDGFLLWIRTDAWNRHELLRRFRSAAANRGLRVMQRGAVPPTARFTDPRDRRHAEELALVSSELALDLCRAGEPAAGSGLPAAVLHVWSLLGGVDDRSRAFFLFSLWEHWTRRMRPHQRVALAARAADPMPAGIAALLDGNRVPAAWHHQLRVVARVARDGGPTPVNYLLYEHAKTGAARLGLAPDSLALATATLRGAVLAGAVTAHPAVRAPEPVPAR